MPGYKVVFQPGHLEVEVGPGSTIMEALDRAGINADFPCGGRGKCGKCRVRVISGAGQPDALEQDILNDQELAAGIRLACTARVYNDMTVKLPNHEPLQHNILITSEEKSIAVDPHIKKIFVQVEKPLPAARCSDWHRLKDGLVRHGYNSGAIKTSVSVLRQLPEAIRESEPGLTAVMYGSEMVGIEEQDTTEAMLGMAFDIGTTTIVGYLLDMYSGQELCVVSTLNPQAKYGADVISRITFAGQAEGLDKLHKAVLAAVNKLIGEAAEKAGISRRQIYAVSIAANTCMHHLFLGISPRYIAVAPYVSAVNEPLVLSAAELQIDICQAGKILVLPNIAGFVGADTTAVLTATEMDRSADIKLVIDIGTNGEIVLGSGERMVACSAAAGPAFEGAQISSGMRGAMGAIDHVYFGEQLTCSVIGGVSPAGICGSALLDTVAGLLESGIINKRGKILPREQITNPKALAYNDHIVELEGEPAFLLADASKTSTGRPIMVTQNDIRELQLAKGAMAAGVRVLMETCGIEVSDIKEVLLAGAFGNYLSPHSACVTGLIPLELEGRIKMVGNAAGTGSKHALLSSGAYRRAIEIARSVEFVELGSYPKFNSIFAECTYFKQIS